VTADGLKIEDLTNGSLAHIRGLDSSLWLDITGGQNPNIYYDSGDLQFKPSFPDSGDNGITMKLLNNGDLYLYEDTGTTAKFVWDSSAERLGIGEPSPATDLHIKNSGSTQLLLESGNTSQGILLFGDAQDLNVGSVSYDHSDNSMRFETNDTERLRIDSSGNVGIGTNPLFGHRLSVQAVNDKNFTVDDNNGTGISLNAYNNSGGNIELAVKSNVFSIHSPTAERMRIDSSGNLLVGTTIVNASGTNVAGVTAQADGRLDVSSAVEPLDVNRIGSDGTIANFRKDGSTVGSIGAKSNDLTIGTGNTGFKFVDAYNMIQPVDSSTGSDRDAAISLGFSNQRFKDLYLSGDANIEGKLGKSYSQTSTSGQTSIIDTGIYAHQINGAIFDVYFKGNANSAGHYDYKSVGHYNVIITTDWNGSSVLHEITQVKLSFAGGGSGDNELVLTAVFWDGTNEHIATAADSNNEIRLKISGYSSTGTTGANQQVRITRRI